MGGKTALTRLEYVIQTTSVIIHGNILTNLKSDNVIQIYQWVAEEAQTIIHANILIHLKSDKIIQIYPV